jgi:hypothetical protein
MVSGSGFQIVGSLVFSQVCKVALGEQADQQSLVAAPLLVLAFEKQSGMVSNRRLLCDGVKR